MLNNENSTATSAHDQPTSPKMHGCPEIRPPNPPQIWADTRNKTQFLEARTQHRQGGEKDKRMDFRLVSPALQSYDIFSSSSISNST
jgi:hypothetical protein